ncbi:MAG: hypothetical protein JO051_07820 [Acidobacteriaceae bacterium]|nr:hypothetical protein [Acidobacteriaceae bacterium]
MIQTLLRSWSLLIACGVLDAMYSFFSFMMEDPDGSVTLRKFAARGTVIFIGKFALAAGVCALAAGIWNFRKHTSWLLMLHGIALSAYGLMSIFWRGRLTFLPIALLFVVMALSIAAFLLANLRSLQQRALERWTFTVTAAVAIGFALAFLSFGFRLLRFQQPGSYFLWVGSFFAFTAVAMVVIALRLNPFRAAQLHSAASGGSRH